MTPTTSTTALPELSCYTANLVDYLSYDVTDPAWLLANAVRLSVRIDACDDELVFSQHARIDRDEHGRELGYQSAATWEETEAALAAELAAAGRVLAVANTAYLPWSPASADNQTPHWVLLLDHFDGSWLVVDGFAALMPHGEQHPYEGKLTGDQLRQVMAPVRKPSSEVRNRDAHALGEEVELPPPGHYRWLTRIPPAGARSSGRWLSDPVLTLRRLAVVLASDERALMAHVEDLWAASRHQRFRLGAFAERGVAPLRRVQPVLDAWAELPRSLRFALDSARRSRPRPGLVDKAFAHLAAVTEEMLAEAPQLLPKG